MTDIDALAERNIKEHDLGEIVICNQCGARKFSDEAIALCCMNGNLRLQSLKLPKKFIRLYKSNNFLRNSRAYNSMFAFTSIGTQVDKSVHDGFTQSYRISGEFSHRIGSLLPADGNPKFAQNCPTTKEVAAIIVDGSE